MRAVRNIAVAAAVGFALLSAGQVAAQALSAEVQALDAQLPGVLVNDPSRIDWDSYGPEFHAESFVDPAVPGGGAARRFHINAASEFIYTAGANIPLVRTVNCGEAVTIGFWARAVSAATDDGRGVLRVRFQQDAPPYPGFGEKTLSIGQTWEWHEVTAIAEQTLNRSDGIVALQFGRTRQVLEIGQALVVSGAAAIAAPKAAATAPAAAPSAAAELPKPLQQAGQLINDPTSREWRIEARHAATTPRDEPGIWLGKATRLTTSDHAEAAVRIGLDMPARPARGEGILIAFAARTVASTNADGRAVLNVALESSTIGEALSGTRIALGPNWQLVRYIARPATEAPEGPLGVAIGLSGPGHAVDIGPVYMIRPQ